MPETSQKYQHEAVNNQNSWLLAREAYPLLDVEARDKAAGYLGDIALRSEVTIERVKEANDSTLLAGTQLAALGDASSRRMVKNNVVTDLAERLFKAGHQTRMYLGFGKNGLEQAGRSLLDVHANTLKYSKLNDVMKKRTLQELENTVLLNELFEAGVLDDYDAVVFSLTPDDEQTKKDYGFFEDTDTCSIQLLHTDKSGIVLETAFVAGKPTPGSARHDKQAIEVIAANNGAELALSGSDESLQHVMLVPKTVYKNGVRDIVEHYDQAAGGTFYGQSGKNLATNYEDYAHACDTRNQDLGKVAEKITKQLISEAHSFKTPMDALKRLDKLSELEGVSYASKNNTIQAAVFGAESAGYIEQARIYAQNGDTGMYEQTILSAQKTAKSSSCPLFKSDSDDDPLNKNSSDNSAESNGTKKWMKCPYCKADKYGDPCAKILECGGCSAKVVNGKIVSKGNGGTAHSKVAISFFAESSKKQLVKV